MNVRFPGPIKNLGQLFRNRNIIIVSDNNVRHISVSPAIQSIALLATVSAIGWASYSTSSYFTDHVTMKAQRQALRQVTNARIDTGFHALLPGAGSAMNLSAKTSVPVSATAGPSLSLTSLDSNKLVARISFLEQKVSELQTTNSSIIERVRDKTSGKIDDLESIIKKTGLKMDDMKHELSDDADSKAKSAEPEGKAQGGPYIPVSTLDMSSSEHALYHDLDKLSALRRIVSNLPLGTPIKNGEEQSIFGHRIDPFTGHPAFHPGLDLSGPAGSRIYSTADGEVTTAERSGAYGNMIDIDHGFGISTRYGHLSEILVKPGQKVHKGDLIGIQGSTGRATGPHLHYEVRYNDEPMNPRNFLDVGRYVSQE